MKKKLIHDAIHIGIMSKTWKIMRITFFLFALSLSQVWAMSSYSQETKLTINMSNTSVMNVLDEIESRSDFYFLFNKNLIDIDRVVNINVESKTIEEILSDLFNTTKVHFIVKNKQIILTTLNYEDDQQSARPIKGAVTDINGEPIVGVTIVIKGTTEGTITDAEGKYVLSDVNPDDIIVFSFIGMLTEEVVAGNQATIDMVMSEDVESLEEVVVIGYGAVKKSDLTGSVASVKGSVITNRQTTQVSQALQGAVSGVMVTRENSDPIENSTIRIRGITTIGSSDPLVIIDGVPGNSINDVNPNDIENISVLKDAASASIYGSRAAAGVILITTKRAKKGEISLNYDFQYGIEKPTELAEYVGAKRWLEMENELKWNDNGNIAGGEYANNPKDIIDNYDDLHAENPDLYPDTDWLGLVLKDNAPRQSHMLSISAGTEHVRTKASLAYDKVDGLYVGKNYERITARFNNDVTISKYFNAAVDFFGKRTVANDPSKGPMEYARISAPIYAAEWTNGMVAEGKAGGNIYGQIKYGGSNKRWYNQVGGKVALNFTPLKGLKITALVSPTLNFDKQKNFHQKVQYTNYDDPTYYVSTLEWAPSTSLYENRSENYQVTKQFLANYDKSLGAHNFNVLAGYEDFSAHYEYLSASTQEMELNSFPYLDLGNENKLSNGGNANENAYRSYFGRIMYNYGNKYFIQGNVRYDGSSRFAKDYRWGTFPSVSAGWVISEESFMENLAVLSFLKLRASYGSLGNERIGNYPYQATINHGSTVFYQGNNVVSANTAAQRYYAIEDITWETTETFDIGFDAAMFRGRFHITADWYQKQTKDMLLELEIPDYFGYDNPNQNTGKMTTTGWDFDLSWQDQIGEFSYAISANMSDFHSEMGDLGGIQFLGDKVKFEGSEFDEWYGYVSDGLFQTADEVANSPVTNATVAPGDVKYKDISGPDGVPDGEITPDYDRQLLGGSLPRYIYGANINLGYKGFDFSLALQGVGKQNVRYSTMMVQPYYENWGSFQSILDGNSWSVYNTEAQNMGAKYPRLSYNSANNNYAMSDYWMFNGRYFRIKNITLGYTIPVDFTKKIHIQNLRVYVSASDILSINKYPKGWDPEVTGTGYPITASYLFGVSVKF